MGFRVCRTHEFAYGHRVYGHEGKCRHLHGHNAVACFVCEAEGLDDVGRVIDFGVIKSMLCNWLEENWDHRFLLWENDPFCRPLRELDPTIVTLPRNPTAENMAWYLVAVVGPQRLRETGVRLVSCTLHETGKCSATYSRE